MRTKGFTLVEVMIVVTIIALLSAIAIPNILRSRHNANESAGLQSLRTLSTALEAYRANQTPPGFPRGLAQLGPGLSDPPYIDPVLAGGVKQGYRFQYNLVSRDRFFLFVQPTVFGVTGSRSFFVDETGVIRVSTTRARADGSSPALE
jgi:prepilin-type N-terminal cleavage/methylation domain-containing protein